MRGSNPKAAFISCSRLFSCWQALVNRQKFTVQRQRLTTPSFVSKPRIDEKASWQVIFGDGKKDIYALHQTFCGIISCVENTNQSPFAPWREWGCLAATTNATKTSLCQEGGLIIINISTFFCYNKCLIISHFNSIKVKRLFFYLSWSFDCFHVLIWIAPPDRAEAPLSSHVGIH